MIKLTVLKKYDPNFVKTSPGSVLGEDFGGFIGLEKPTRIQRGFDQTGTSSKHRTANKVAAPTGCGSSLISPGPMENRFLSCSYSIERQVDNQSAGMFVADSIRQRKLERAGPDKVDKRPSSSVLSVESSQSHLEKSSDIDESKLGKIISSLRSSPTLVDSFPFSNDASSTTKKNKTPNPTNDMVQKNSDDVQSHRSLNRTKREVTRSPKSTTQGCVVPCIGKRTSRDKEVSECAPTQAKQRRSKRLKQLVSKKPTTPPLPSTKRPKRTTDSSPPSKKQTTPTPKHAPNKISPSDRSSSSVCKAVARWELSSTPVIWKRMRKFYTPSEYSSTRKLRPRNRDGLFKGQETPRSATLHNKYDLEPRRINFSRALSTFEEPTLSTFEHSVPKRLPIHNRKNAVAKRSVDPIRSSKLHCNMVPLEWSKDGIDARLTKLHAFAELCVVSAHTGTQDNGEITGNIDQMLNVKETVEAAEMLRGMGAEVTTHPLSRNPKNKEVDSGSSDESCKKETMKTQTFCESQEEIDEGANPQTDKYPVENRSVQDKRKDENKESRPIEGHSNETSLWKQASADEKSVRDSDPHVDSEQPSVNVANVKQGGNEFHNDVPDFRTEVSCYCLSLSVLQELHQKSSLRELCDEYIRHCKEEEEASANAYLCDQSPLLPQRQLQAQPFDFNVLPTAPHFWDLVYENKHQTIQDDLFTREIFNGEVAVGCDNSSSQGGDETMTKKGVEV